MYKPMDTAISKSFVPVVVSPSPGSWIIQHRYYADYASIMGIMGLPVMHHTIWDNLVSWVGTHMEQLAE